MVRVRQHRRRGTKGVVQHERSIKSSGFVYEGKVYGEQEGHIWRNIKDKSITVEIWSIPPDSEDEGERWYGFVGKNRQGTTATPIIEADDEASAKREAIELMASGEWKKYRKIDG